jgi:hypothetical protein
MSSPGAPFRDNPEARAPEPNGIDNDFQVRSDPSSFYGIWDFFVSRIVCILTLANVCVYIYSRSPLLAVHFLEGVETMKISFTKSLMTKLLLVADVAIEVHQVLVVPICGSVS